MIFALASVVLSLVAFSLSIILVPYSMGRKKDSEVTLRRVRGKGWERNTGIMNNNPVLKKLEPQAERNYQRKLDLWDLCSERGDMCAYSIAEDLDVSTVTPTNDSQALPAPSSRRHVRFPAGTYDYSASSSVQSLTSSRC
jgi:hypothetical protein